MKPKTANRTQASSAFKSSGQGKQKKAHHAKSRGEGEEDDDFRRPGRRKPEAETDPRLKGELAEDMAARYLSGKAFAILDRNYRIYLGEVDIIAKEGDTLVFVEVKYLSDPQKNYYPEEQLTARKKRSLIAAAGSYLNSIRHSGPCRFDVIAISPLPGPEKYEIRHIPSAFEA